MHHQVTAIRSQHSAGHLVIIIKFVALLCAAYFPSKAGVPGFGSDNVLQCPLGSRDGMKAVEFMISVIVLGHQDSGERRLMDLEYELLQEFDRVVTQCSQGVNIPSNVNISDNAGGSEEQSSMMLCITSGLGEAGSNVASRVVMNETEEVMKLALAEQNGIQPSSFPPEELNTPQPVNWKMVKRVPHFLSKVYQIVDDPTTDHLVHWGLEGKSFVVQDTITFCSVILPKYFKHGNFSSFIRQLNTYGFRKIDCDRWEFATREFQKGRIDQLKYIKRRTSITKQMGTRSRKHDDKFQKHLKSLSTQITNLSQQVEVSSSILSAYENKVQDIELKYKQMASVLSKTIQDPGLVAELLERKASIVTPSEQELTEANGIITKLSSETSHLLPDINVTAQSPNRTEMKLSLCMSTPIIGESSRSPNEPRGSVVKMVMNDDDDDSMGAMQNALMNEMPMEPCEGLTSEKCVMYFHELASLIPADELDSSWVSYANPHVDTKPKLKSEEAHGC